MQNLKRLLSYAKGQSRLYVLALIFTLFSQVIVAMQPQLIRITIDSVIGGAPLPAGLISGLVALFKDYLNGTSGLFVMASLVVGFSLIRGLFTFGRINTASVATERSIKTLRNRLYNHIQLLPYSYHAKAETGDLIQRCTSDVETIRLALYSQIMDTISAVFLIIYTIYLMAQLNTKLMLISFFIMPLTFFSSAIFFKRIQRQFKKATEYEAAMTTAIQENLTGIRVVKAFTRHQYEIEKFIKRSERYRNQNLKINNSFAAFWAFSDFLSIAQVFGIIIYGSMLAYRNEITAGDLVAFISYTGMLIWPVRRLGRIISNIGKSFVSANRIETILNEKAEEIFPTGEKPEIKGNIVFDSVSFSYPETQNQKILDNVSFNIKSGQTLAILGPTGSGKSSLVHLLARLYEYDSGSIKMDGRELNTIDKGWIRSQVGLILQEPFLYGRTIMENLKLAVPDISDSSARHYSQVASLDEEINRFEKGYETLVGERGVSLSGGQKQRLAIARTLIKDSPVLIFDDSLSAVDTQTDISIRSALKEEKGNKTMIIISHRISTICDADNIIVLEDGKISQEGTHEQLIAQEGLYKRIYDIQSSVQAGA
ncbi:MULTISPECIES: ABC transporter ATP-binding protein [unclassified Treponema]|uniref:ABC transporter ATP-binding protein n=1 Tax=unclassified Treponema TaxID=2638727 RepID=UPI0020A3D143|nr:MULTISPECIES: ABC transporter ATP-binding protein [unclassified Treponema]UTC67102.1 ABC transporter ATP-binding protein [Treponema sp. OMZ 789]UTC69833.1 ABC transporter ATP-binding protein [Treponema sp. OMZ 790]UTC72547.1 ABC transporter ATP-binding protein [Treponema sp. OMZ 791]